MKHLSILALFVTLNFCYEAKAQLTETTASNNGWTLIGRVKYAGPDKATLERSIQSADTIYLLTFYDERPQEKKYFSIKFNGSGDALQSLYEGLLSYTEGGKQAGRTFTLGETKLVVMNGAALGLKTVYLAAKDKRIELRRGELKRLFNKED